MNSKRAERGILYQEPKKDLSEDKRGITPLSKVLVNGMKVPIDDQLENQQTGFRKHRL